MTCCRRTAVGAVLSSSRTTKTRKGMVQRFECRTFTLSATMVRVRQHPTGLAPLQRATRSYRYFITPKKLREAYDRGEVTKTRVEELRSKTVKATLSAEPQRETVVIEGGTDTADVDDILEGWDVRFSSQLETCVHSACALQRAAQEGMT